ncbi:ankyrin repeat domain-containing protein [Wolbachia endosymbiont (group E) of Neria commutata]|uniref:ankyrin repeat domain-containing protein n=1 Tax=Wolbachia endosymbiont (group E) of Neria commutata TaxID=3066149 RepID=UPI003132E04E
MTEENGLAQQDSSVQLFEAVKNGSVEDVQKLIDAGADVIIQDKNGDTPLHIAAYRHSKISYNASEYPHNHEKCKKDGRKDSLDIIEVLIKKNKSIINTTNKKGKTALYQAIFPLLDEEEERIESVIKVVIEKGAAINTDIDTQNYDHMAPLRDASQSNASRAVIMFLENGADPNIQSSLGTALHYAVLAKQENVVRILANRGVNCSIRSETYGITPLYCTAIESRAYGIQKQHPGVMAKVLPENGADPNIKLKDGSYEIMSTITSTHSNALPTTIYMIAYYASNLDEELKQQIEVNENLRDDFKKGERIRNYIDRILLDVQSEVERGRLKIDLNFGYSYNLREFIEKFIEYRGLEKLLEDEDAYPFEGNSVLDFYRLDQYIQEHVFLHNNKIIIDILSEVYGRKLQGMSVYELDEFICESDKKFKDICDIELINTLFDFDISKLNVIVPTLHQLAYVEVLRLLENDRHEELRYSFGKFIKTQEAHIREQNSEEALNDIRYLYEEADEKVDTKLKAPIRDSVISSESAKKLEKDSQAYPQKPKSNSKYCCIGVCTIAGLAIGLIVAHITGAPEVVFIVAAVVGILIGAAFGVGIDYGISKCFANPNVEAHKQPELVLQ